jgi:hypothetical protein
MLALSRSSWSNRPGRLVRGTLAEILIHAQVQSVRTAGDDYKETQSEYCSYTDLLLEFHLQPRNHGYG